MAARKKAKKTRDLSAPVTWCRIIRANDMQICCRLTDSDDEDRTAEPYLLTVEAMFEGGLVTQRYYFSTAADARTAFDGVEAEKFVPFFLGQSKQWFSDMVEA